MAANSPRPPRINRHLLDQAGVTSREQQALTLWDPSPGKRTGGYRTVALALDISPAAARDRIQRALRKLERHLRNHELAA